MSPFVFPVCFSFVPAAFLTLAMSMVSFGQTLYFSDFESDDGGWTATGDWQYGMPTGFAGAPFGGPEPVGGFSGDFAWGTIIGGAHNPSTVSDLTQNFDFSGSAGTMLSFYEYSESGGNTFDMASVLVNGNQEYLSDGNSLLDWRLVSLDLSAYDGLASVDVDFNFSTTGVVERVGWYIDDVRITSAIPEPTTAGLLVLAGLGMVARRRRN